MASSVDSIRTVSCEPLTSVLSNIYTDCVWPENGFTFFFNTFVFVGSTDAYDTYLSVVSLDNQCLVLHWPTVRFQCH